MNYREIEYAAAAYYQRKGELLGEQSDVTDDDELEDDSDIYNDLRERFL